MSENLDGIKVLPKLSHPNEKGRTFRLLWALDLVSDSSQCFASLAFQNVKTGFIIIDRIPPELLSYCSAGTYFCDGKKLPLPVDGQIHQFTINSTDNNQIIDASEAFTDEAYDLSLNASCHKYATAARHQSCFVQQVGNTTIVIPCFVIAATYYFKSTSLRETILSRKLGSLFHECTLDEDFKHAVIHLKDAANVRDAQYIARLQLSEFALQRINLCKDHLYANKDATYKRLKIDFPVKQPLKITARGRLTSNPDGRKTFIVFQIIEEDSLSPFDSIDVHYEKREDPSDSAANFPAKLTKHTNQMLMESPATNIVRRFLEGSPTVENRHRKEVRENRIPTIKNTTGEQSPYPEYDNTSTDLSSQPSAPTDNPVSEATIQEKDPGDAVRAAFDLEEFGKLAQPLQDYSAFTEYGEAITVTEYSSSNKIVCKRNNGANILTLKESYDHTNSKRRKCVYVTFKVLNRHVCLIEIDQTGLPSKGCSTMVLISTESISDENANLSVKGYVHGHDLEKRAADMGKKSIIFLTKKHPTLGDEAGYIVWRHQLMRKIEIATNKGDPLPVEQPN